MTLNPNETRQVTFAPEKFKQLEIADPRLWWPHTVGPQNLYDLNLTFKIKRKMSDTEKTRFGIREITSWMNTFEGKRTRVFQVNGKNIVIRGGGYVEDMMLRPSDKRVDTDILYAKHMGLNALRMEAPRDRIICLRNVMKRESCFLSDGAAAARGKDGKNGLHMSRILLK